MCIVYLCLVACQIIMHVYVRVYGRLRVYGAVIYTTYDTDTVRLTPNDFIIHIKYMYVVQHIGTHCVVVHSLGVILFTTNCTHNYKYGYFDVCIVSSQAKIYSSIHVHVQDHNNNEHLYSTRTIEHQKNNCKQKGKTKTEKNKRISQQNPKWKTQHNTLCTKYDIFFLLFISRLKTHTHTLSDRFLSDGMYTIMMTHFII